MPLRARAVAGAPAINAACPFSGKPVAADSLAEIDGTVIGFCNPFCRDKVVADAEAWPAAMALLAGVPGPLRLAPHGLPLAHFAGRARVEPGEDVGHDLFLADVVQEVVDVVLV